MIKWVSDFRLVIKKWQWWMWMVVAYWRTRSQSLLAWSEGWRPPGAESAFTKWTGWTLVMACHDDSTCTTNIIWLLLLVRLMGHYCFTRWRLSSSSVVICNAAGGWVGQARGRSGGRHCTAGQYGYVPLGWHLVIIIIILLSYITVIASNSGLLLHTE